MTQSYNESQVRTAPQPLSIEPPSVESLLIRGSAIPYLRLLWRRQRFLGRAGWIGLLAGTLTAFLLPTRYQSRTQLMPPDNRPGEGMLMAGLAAKSGSLAGVAGDVLGLKSSGALFIGILTSATLEDRIVGRFHLQKIYGTRLEDDARRQLDANTSIFEDRKSGIITIDVSDRDARRAAALAAAYVEELNRLVAELSTSAAHRERVFLEERLRSVKQELDQTARDLSQFESKNDAIDIPEQGKSMVDAGAVLMGQLIAAQSELKGLEPIYTRNNVHVQSVEARIAELRRQLDNMRGGDQDPDRKQSPQPDNAAHSLYPSMRALPLLGVTYSDLYRRAKIKEALYETLTQEYELARVEEAKETPSVKVLDPARVPERRSFPPRMQIVLLCATGSVLGAAVVTLARARWQQMDSARPGKIFAREVFAGVGAHMPWHPPGNGSRLHAMSHWIWLQVDRRRRSTAVS